MCNCSRKSGSGGRRSGIIKRSELLRKQKRTYEQNNSENTERLFLPDNRESKDQERDMETPKISGS